ncbi:MAG: histidine phosphatase family protein [Deltaproteobacteria bacterium]|nr:histidine phosphatase family protein [Deltaproteobacteria bacterium]
MFELIVVRHGQTDWNIQGQKRVMGRRPIPLNDEGRRQATAAASALAGVPLAAVYTSPVVRARETAQCILNGRDGIPLIEEEGLAEINYGDWLDKTLEEIMATEAWLTYWERGRESAVPGGERVIDVQARAVGVVKRARARYCDGVVCCVSHADVIKALCAYYLCLDLNQWQSFKIDNGSISVIRFEPDRPRIFRLNAYGY